MDHTIIHRWVQHDALELDRHVQWCRNRNSGSWYIDETDVKRWGEWAYLFRTIGDQGPTLKLRLAANIDR